MDTRFEKEVAPEELKQLGPHRQLVRVRSITYQGEDINAYEVVHPQNEELPEFTAGSHVDLYFRDGRIRQYSLCNAPWERNRYIFAVQRDPNGRGGSKAIFERVHVGRILTISEPRNNFSLAKDAAHHLMIAGGIGVTPIMSMLYALSADGCAFTLHYCTRTPERTAFVNELQPFIRNGTVLLHHDGGDPSRGIDLGAILATFQRNTHLYYCGPPGLMAAIKRASSHWPTGTVHSEYFNVSSSVSGGGADIAAHSATLSPQEMEGSISVGFQVKLARCGIILDVPSDKSIAQVLRENGFDVATSCESGLCGTCRTRYLSGIPDHRDYILQDDEKTSEILICCSRAKSPLLVLDL